MSFVRSGTLRLNRRRYELTVDSWFLLHRPYQELSPKNDEDELPEDADSIMYYHSYTKLLTGRPGTPRLELQMQMTFQFNRVPTRKQMQVVHILSAIQLVGYLIQEGCEPPVYGYNPITEDLPLVQYNAQVQRHFAGSSILHFVFQQIYQCLVHINPQGKYLEIQMFHIHT